jgi:hypothetical protein
VISASVDEKSVAIVEIQVIAGIADRGHVEIKIAVVVYIAGHDAVGVRGKPEPGGPGARFKGAIAQIAVQDVRVIEARENEVDEAVAVKIAGCGTARKKRLAGQLHDQLWESVDMRDTGAGRDICKHDGRCGRLRYEHDRASGSEGPWERRNIRRLASVRSSMRGILTSNFRCTCFTHRAWPHDVKHAPTDAHEPQREAFGRAPRRQ